MFFLDFSIRYPVSKEQLLGLTSTTMATASRVVNRNDYPYVNDFHPSYNWPSLFSNPASMCCDVQMKPSELGECLFAFDPLCFFSHCVLLEMHNLKLLHNRIKQRVIGSINNKRVVTAR